MKTRPSSGLSGQEFRVGLGPAGSCGRCTGGSGGCRERQATLPWGGPSGPQPGPGPECLQVASRLRGGHGGGRSTSVLRARVRLWKPLGPGRGSCPPAHELWGAGLPRAQQSVPWRRVPPCLSPAVTRGGEVSLPPTHLGAGVPLLCPPRRRRAPARAGPGRRPVPARLWEGARVLVTRPHPAAKESEGRPQPAATLHGSLGPDK